MNLTIYVEQKLICDPKITLGSSHYTILAFLIITVMIFWWCEQVKQHEDKRFRNCNTESW